MDVARPTFLRKGNNVFTSVARKTSCSSGWLRLVVQTIFATITVASFILIVLMAVKNPNPSPALRPLAPPRCQILGCRVICKNAPYFKARYEDVILSVAEADTKCVRVVLELQRPYFVNNTLPENWLSNMRSNVHQLIINGGNLKHIAHRAFMSQFSGNIRILVLQNIHIVTMESTSLVGLSSARTFNIINSKIDSVSQNLLRPIDDTLETLTISECGQWDPVNFTGANGLQRLGIVDFSYNDFDDILDTYTFIGLGATKILYLNFCRITAIGAGTFDHLTSIEVLYLNNNMLITVPPGLFSNIVALENPRPRINLQDNYWLCDCAADDLRQLIRKDLLLIESTCTYPEEMHSKKFTQFENICNNSTDDSLSDYRDEGNTSIAQEIPFYPDSIYVNESFCSRNEFKKDSVRIISPVQKNKCSSMNYNRLYFSALNNQINKYLVYNTSEWIQFSYYLTTKTFSVVQVGAKSDKASNGLLWYQNACPHEIYCLDSMPTFLRVFSFNSSARYIFCPIFTETKRVDHENCVGYELPTHEERTSSRKTLQVFRVTLYITTVVVCLCFGALLLYGVIRRKPTLLKGSKRILFVKHKNVDVLVLPPKVAPRNNLKTDAKENKDKNIFTLSMDQKLKPPNLERMKSVRSDKSGSPSYISAMQPTEDQLAEWRIKRLFNNDLTISSLKSELSTLSFIGDPYYNSLNDSDKTYESLK